MSGAVVNVSVQGLDEAELVVTNLSSLGRKHPLVSAEVKGDGVKVALLDVVPNVRRVLTGLLAQLDDIEAGP